MNQVVYVVLMFHKQKACWPNKLRYHCKMFDEMSKTIFRQEQG